MDKILNEVRPFCALHYNPIAVDDIGLCLSQPYDVISPEEQEAYYRRHPYNVIRLILGKENHGDTDANNRYTRTKELLKEWKEQNILTMTRRPSFWVYEQEFELPEIGRKKVKGFIGLVRLRDYEEQRILPHEKVLEKVIEDRLKLTRAINMQTEYIWSIYQDKSYEIDQILDETDKGIPLIDYFEEENSVQHRFTRLVNPDKCKIIQRMMGREKIYIADGHHRYQTMLTYRDEMRKQHPDAGEDAPWEYIMMFLVNSEHEGLTILPCHRLLHSLQNYNPYALESSIKDQFHVKKYSFSNGNESDARKRWLRDLASVKPGEHKLGAFIINIETYYLLTLRDAEAYEKMVQLNFSSPWKRLDVNILNTIVFNKILGITEEQLSLQTYTRYTKNLQDALDEVAQNKAQVALILNATKLNAVMTIADNGEKMPRKSTYFYPKPVSGLVFYPMDSHRI